MQIHNSPSGMQTQQSAGDMIEFATLVELLRTRAARQGEQTLYTFLVDGEREELQMTYAELDRRARQVAARLQQVCQPGDRALLLYAPSLDYIVGFFGCLYANVIAVPAYPPNPSRLTRSLPRITAIIENCQARVALTTDWLLGMVSMVLEEMPELAQLEWIATDTLDDGLEQQWQLPQIDTQTLAFLQYTSGSTGTPKGVMLSHYNLLTNSALISQVGEMLPIRDRGVSWLPPYHDMGLIGGILQPMYAGSSVVLMSPVDFLQRPMRWLQAISRYKATISAGPNFAFDLCARKATAEQIAELDLSSWRVVFDGAEPVRPETIRRFCEVFAPTGFRVETFYPCYGLAEATLLVTGGDYSAAPIQLTVDNLELGQNRVRQIEAGLPQAVTLVGCGRVREGQQLLIVNPETLERCAEDQVGEIWISGPSIARGYWERPEETERTFQAFVANSAEGPFMRTGDLGFVQQGELFVTGRLKDLIIIDGRNHYPQDIEATVEASHPALRPGCTAAFSVDIENAERLVVVTEVERGLMSSLRQGTGQAEKQALLAAVRKAVSEVHDLRVHSVVLLKTGYIPKTSSGKIQRHACRAGFLAGTLDTVEE